MNGAHDLGGMQCYGSIRIEKDEPIFHDEWEKRVFAATMVSFGALGSIDAFRHAIERMGAEKYLSTTYYEHWLAALEMRIEETKLHSKAKSDVPLTPEDVDAIVPTGGNYFREGLIQKSVLQLAIGSEQKILILPDTHVYLDTYGVEKGKL